MLTGVTGLGACVHSAVYSARAEARHPPKGEQVEVNGHAVHLVERGEAGAPAVLMIHGASANASEFAWTLAPRLEDRFHVLMADRPGHGYSDRPKDGHLLEVQARQLAGALDEVGVDELVGQHVSHDERRLPDHPKRQLGHRGGRRRSSPIRSRIIAVLDPLRW